MLRKFGAKTCLLAVTQKGQSSSLRAIASGFAKLGICFTYIYIYNIILCVKACANLVASCSFRVHSAELESDPQRFLLGHAALRPQKSDQPTRGRTHRRPGDTGTSYLVSSHPGGNRNARWDSTFTNSSFTFAEDHGHSYDNEIWTFEIQTILRYSF